MSIIGYIFRSFDGHNVKTLKTLYFLFVVPVLEYASPVWNPEYRTSIDKIDRVQKYFTRRLLKHSDMTYPQRLKLLSMQPLELRRLHIDIKLVHDIVYGRSCINFHEFFEC